MPQPQEVIMEYDEVNMKMNIGQLDVENGCENSYEKRVRKAM